MKPVSYSKEVKAAAKDADCGMFTLSIVFPDGTRLDEQQAAVSLSQLHFLKWALAAAATEELRSRIDLEALIASLRDQLPVSATAEPTPVYPASA